MATADQVRAGLALDKLASLHPKAIDLGLDRSFRLLEKLGNPQDHLPPVIHIAGTNGKGSTLSFMRAMLESAGMRVHAYTSPHLVRFHERIRLAGELIGDAGLADLLEEVIDRNNGDAVTFFEVTTAAAMLAFSRQPAEALLLETGLGGIADSTNVITRPAATVITPIARDHEHFLGSDLAGIASQKAGIMRRGVAAFIARQQPPVRARLDAEAARIGALASYAGEAFDHHSIDTAGNWVFSDAKRNITLPPAGLAGNHQRENASLAIAAVLHGWPALDEQSVADGVAGVRWPARIQQLTHGRLVKRCPPAIELVLDGAHNSHGAEALAATLAKTNPGRKWVVIAGALKTRPAADFLRPLKPLAQQLFSIAIPGQEASLAASALAKAATSIGLPATAMPDLDAALTAASALAMEGDQAILITGSLYLSGKVLEANGTPPG